MENRDGLNPVNITQRKSPRPGEREAAGGQQGEKLCDGVSARLRRPGTYRTDALVARQPGRDIPPPIPPRAVGCSA